MRIISGKYRGRKLNPTNLKFTRPTTDFAREGLFNMLNSRVDWPDLMVLDLYTGSGSMIFEFLSRGVKYGVAVDSNVESLKFISSIKSQWGADNMDVIKSDAIKYLHKCHEKFDIIFADPPYDEDDHLQIHHEVFNNNLVKENGYLILEHHKRKSFETLEYFSFQRSFGNVNFSFFSKTF